jgi:hypothetical protein
MNSEKLTPGSDENFIGSPSENQSPDPQAPDEVKAPPSSTQEHGLTADQQAAARQREEAEIAAIFERSARRLARSFGKFVGRSNVKRGVREGGSPKRTSQSRRRRKPQPIWLERVATAMADGTPLRIALMRCGVTDLDEKQIRALYHNVEFREMYQERRRKWGQDFYFKRLTREELFRRTL